MPEKKLVGEVTHYFTNISVAVVRLSGPLKIGDMISIEGPITNLQEEVSSIQVKHKGLTSGKKRQEVGIKTEGRVREKDKVYKL